MVISNMCVFLQHFYLVQDGGSELLCSDGGGGGGDPLNALVDVALGQQVGCPR